MVKMRNTTTSGVYSIELRLDPDARRTYVGSSVDVVKRLNDHKRQLGGGVHASKALQRNWTKYGAAKFQFKVLEIVKNPDKLAEREEYWLERLSAFIGNGGFNVNPFPANGAAGAAARLQKTGMAKDRRSGRMRSSAQAVDGDRAGKTLITPAQCRVARTGIGWKQSELAERAGVSLPVVQMFETKGRVPITNNLRAIKAVLEADGVQFDALGGGRVTISFLDQDAS